MKRKIALCLALLAVPLAALAWWNADWKVRKKITFNTSEQGVAIKEPVGPIAIPVRLHTGNFLFADARPDGADIRFVAADDKTPLKHTIEVFDAANQLAILWVQVPRLAPGASDAIWMYSGNDKVPAIDDPKGTFDPRQLLLVLGPARDGKTIADSSAYANPIDSSGVAPSQTGVIGGALAFSGAPLKVASSAQARVPADQSVTFSAWVRPTAEGGQLLQWGAFVVDIKGAALAARFGKAQAAGGALKRNQWNHVAVTAGEKLAIYVNGAEVAAQAAQRLELAGEMVIGAGLNGEMDHVGVASTARSADWTRVEAANGMDGKLVGYGEPETPGEGAGHASYLRILVDNLTPDAWVVICILGVMMVISFTIMALKAGFLARVGKANEKFLDQFDKLGLEIVQTGAAAGRGFELKSAVQSTPAMERNSTLYRMYSVAVTELSSRTRTQGAAINRQGIAQQTLESIKASVDATLVRERQRLEARLVMLTIAISGGPFLGLLGTVVGVMIVFAAVAAAGDVNINAIAPGIAAALLATVAGLGVAIPCLFGYNYLASRVKSINADMQVFADVIVTRLAERFAPHTSAGNAPLHEGVPVPVRPAGYTTAA